MDTYGDKEFSTLNIVYLCKLAGEPKINTTEFNELKWARKVASEFGTCHREITISEKDAYEYYPNMIYQLDEPLADCVCIPFYYVSKLAKDNGVTVVQVGEGADELFFGYDSYASY
ncbi:MAG: asparagine synthase-related protein, partial [Candidatus Hodarchaeota archaeon]